MEPIKTEKKTLKIDRIVLDPETMTILSDITLQAQNELGDLVHINTKTIANFLLRKRSSPLTKDELQDLKNENHDVIKALKKATQEAIKLKQQGAEIDLNEILKILHAPSVNEKSSIQKPHRKKKTAKESNLIVPDNNHAPTAIESET